MKNKKGFALYELLISMSFLAILLISLFSIIYALNVKLSDIIINNEINDKKSIIYKKIAEDFNLKNIKYKENDDGSYTLQIYDEADTNMTDSMTEKTLKINNNGQQLIYGDESKSSDIIDLDSDVIKINSIHIDTDSTLLSYENYDKYLVMTITFEYNGKTKDMKIYCVNAIEEI